jgi:major membrane immunogen (membrane-anchored lipoprotein)
MKLLRQIGLIVFSFLLFAACKGTTLKETFLGQSGRMHDGYYTAKGNGYDDDGWEDFLTIYVSDNQIVTVEFNARTKYGFIRSWDLDYQRRQQAESGLHPSEYLRTFTTELLNLQNPANVLVVAGAEKQHAIFQLLAETAIVQAKAGDKTIAMVDLP